MPVVPGFLPSLNAPKFINDGQGNPWPAGAPLQVTIPPFPTVNIDSTGFGLCGGMSFLTRDIFEAGMPQLQSPGCSMLPIPLFQHIMSRLIDSFQPVPAIPTTWMSFDEAEFHDSGFGQGTFGRSVLQAPSIMDDIDNGILCPIGLVLVNHTFWPWDVFRNHVELVYGYDHDTSTGMLTLKVYDCDQGAVDNITISLDISSPTPAKTITTNGKDGVNPGTIQGFFKLTYTHVDPSPAYIDDAIVSVTKPPPVYMMPGETASVQVQVTNVGSTNWATSQQYLLGSQLPEDNKTWGSNRQPLPSSVSVVVSQSAVTFDFNITAPQTTGDFDFAWRMVRETVHWFGAISPVTRVHVTARPPQPPPEPPPPPPGGSRQ